MSVGPQARGVVSLRLAGESLEEQGGTPALLVLKERRLQVYIEAVAGAGFGDDCRSDSGPGLSSRQSCGVWHDTHAVGVAQLHIGGALECGLAAVVHEDSVDRDTT